MTQPVEKSVTLPITPEEAFDLYTSGIDTWWPKDRHSTSAMDGAAAQSMTIEPGRGGRILERRHDGETAEWGRITEWAPGERLCHSWYPGGSSEQAMEVEISFAHAAAGCTVRLIHSGFDRMGDNAAQLRANYDSGWNVVLDCLTAAFAPTRV